MSVSRPFPGDSAQAPLDKGLLAPLMSMSRLLKVSISKFFWVSVIRFGEHVSSSSSQYFPFVLNGYLVIDGLCGEIKMFKQYNMNLFSRNLPYLTIRSPHLSPAHGLIKASLKFNWFKLLTVQMEKLRRGHQKSESIHVPRASWCGRCSEEQLRAGSPGVAFTMGLFYTTMPGCPQQHCLSCKRN